MTAYLGIDTSCYTTSVAIVDLHGILLADERIPLVVKPGGRGLAQSEMVFQHVRNLPVIFDAIRKSLPEKFSILGVAATSRPRPVEDSYMPVFLTGHGLGRSVAALEKRPFFSLSHQEGHILAGLWSAEKLEPAEWIAAHVSGGTTEIHRVVYSRGELKIELLGGSCDLQAGQFVDRIGVELDLPFPAGPHLERLARTFPFSPESVPVSTDDTNMSFSGPASHFSRRIAAGDDPANIAASVQVCIAETLSRALRNAVQQTGTKKVLLVGGVMANQFIRKSIADKLREEGSETTVPDPRYCSDNAVGAAIYVRNHVLAEK